MSTRPPIVHVLEVSWGALVVTIAAAILIAASGWQIQARLFPTVVAIPLLVLGLVQLVTSLRSGSDGDAVTAEVDEIGLWNRAARTQVLRLAAWVLAFLACLALFSFPIGLTVGIFLYLRFESREGWLRCLVLAAITFAYMYFIFDRGLHLPWPEGLLTRYLVP